MEEVYLLILGMAFCLATITHLALSQKQRDVLFRRLRLRERRPSSATTPPRSLSPNEKTPITVTSPTEFIDIFPPSRREALAKVMEMIPQPGRASLVGGDAEKSMTSDMMMPFEANYMEVDGFKHTPTGFSVDEIKALGHFPNYAELSGVPLPEPYHDFDITKALPRPYRPFRWTYHQTMALSKLEPDWWLELENTYKSRIGQRKALFAQHGEAVLQWLPGSELASKELMEMALQFLVARYPHYFSLSEDKQTFTNNILGTTQDVRSKHPLSIMLDNVPEDFAVMLRNPETGYYFFRAGIVCSALGWNVGTKIGLQLHQIHAPIPDYKEKLQFSMDRFFSKMPTDRPIQRGSWGLEVDTPLYMPPGDPHEKYRKVQSPDVTLDRCHLRVDWQTLRRLPLSGAIVFNFKAIFTPLADFRHEAFVPALALKLLNEGKRSLMLYKGTWHVEHVCKPALERYAREQVEAGVVPADWHVNTLDEQPFYPGWRDGWRKRQGF